VGRCGELQAGEGESVKGMLFLIVLSNSVLQCKCNAPEKKNTCYLDEKLYICKTKYPKFAPWTDG
jgi:hypothetical protein